MEKKLTGHEGKKGTMPGMPAKIQPEPKSAEPLQLTADLEGNYLLDKRSTDLKAIGLFYAPAGGYVHHIAKQIKRKIVGHKVEMWSITDVQPEKLLDYRNIILVCSSLGRNTWEQEQKDKWALFTPGVRKLLLDGRNVAIVGLGDHVTYPGNFVDGMGDLADVVLKAGAVLIGKTPSIDYIFDASRAFRDGLFVGLPLDEEYEADKTGERLDKWASLVTPEF